MKLLNFEVGPALLTKVVGLCSQAQLGSKGCFACLSRKPFQNELSSRLNIHRVDSKPFSLCQFRKVPSRVFEGCCRSSESMFRFGGRSNGVLKSSNEARVRPTELHRGGFVFVGGRRSVRTVNGRVLWQTLLRSCCAGFYN